MGWGDPVDEKVENPEEKKKSEENKVSVDPIEQIILEGQQQKPEENIIPVMPIIPEEREEQKSKENKIPVDPIEQIILEQQRQKSEEKQNPEENIIPIMPIIPEKPQNQEEKESEEDDLWSLDLQQSSIVNNRIADVVPEKIQKKQAQKKAPDKKAPDKKADKDKKEEYKPVEEKSFWGALRHGMYTALCAISTVTIGGLGWLVTAPFTTRTSKIKSVTTTKDASFIPGTKNEKFDMTLPKDDNQPILNDKRRVPLVYEEEIAEDPNLKPTISFNFSQDVEGKSVDGDGSHASVTIKYTKKNPISGKMQRYKASFGFYSKGGFRDKTISYAIGQNGMYIPGQLKNDSVFKGDVGIEYEVTNKQINKVILAAQQYEEGGYNIVERNCTTFAHDMGIAAGVDVDSFMKLQDLDSSLGSKATMGVMGIGTFFGGPIMSRLGRNAMIDKAGKEDYSYQQFGKKMLNTQDIKRLDKRSLNLRLKGYLPSATAENLRRIQGGKLKSEHFGLSRYKNYSNRFGGNSRVAKMTSLATDEAKELRKDITKNYKNGGIGKDMNKALNSISKDISDFKVNMNLLLKGKKASKNNNDFEDMSFQEKLEAASDLTKKLTESKNRLNDFYKNHLNNDPIYNIRMQHIYSMFEHFQTIVNDEYVALKHSPDLNVVKGESSYFDNEKYKDLIDFERDSSTAIKNFQYGSAYLKPKTGQTDDVEKLSVPLYVAAVKTFGSVDNYLKYQALKEKSKNIEKAKEEQAKAAKNAKKGNKEKKIEELTPKEQQALHELQKRDVALTEFQSAEVSFLSDRKFSEADYQFAMIDLPLAEMKSQYKYATLSPMKVSETYQSIALERVFPGLKNELKNLGIDKITSDPAAFKDTLNNFLKSRFEDKNNKELSKLQGSMISFVTKKNPVKVTQANYAEFTQDILYKSHRLISDTFKNVYLKTVLTELVNDKVANMKDLDDAARAERAKNMLKTIDVKDMNFDSDERFASFRDAVHKNLGVDFGVVHNGLQEIDPNEDEVKEDKVSAMLKA